MSSTLGWILALVVSVVHATGVFSAFHAILNARTASGAIAWSISLITFPWFTLPVYWALSREKFYGYIKMLRANALNHDRYRQVAEFVDEMRAYNKPAPEGRRKTLSVLEQLGGIPFTRGNRVELLIDGVETMEALYDGLRQAEEYALVYFYIVADDHVGREFKSVLMETATRGVRVYFMYDELGCLGNLTTSYLQELRNAGIDVRPFYTTKGRANKLQINFRNHRKIVVIDGRLAYTGGVNVHDDSMGVSPFYGAWRDTHTVLEGPAVQGVQLIFAEDWYWATGTLLPLNWKPQACEGHDRKALFLATGPAAELDNGILFFVECINAARSRMWVASPYFIPDPSVVDALILASLRGVDVRIILPLGYDILFMYLAAFSYFPEFENTNVKVFRYETGHPHQKVMLIDDDLAWVGSSNMDNRSMRLNFEGNLVVADEDFASEVEAMLLRDLEDCQEVGAHDYYRRNIVFKLGVQAARLLSPIL